MYSGVGRPPASESWLAFTITMTRIALAPSVRWRGRFARLLPVTTNHGARTRQIERNCCTPRLANGAIPQHLPPDDGHPDHVATAGRSLGPTAVGAYALAGAGAALGPRRDALHRRRLVLQPAGDLPGAGDPGDPLQPAVEPLAGRARGRAAGPGDSRGRAQHRAAGAGAPGPRPARGDDRPGRVCRADRPLRLAPRVQGHAGGIVVHP